MNELRKFWRYYVSHWGWPLHARWRNYWYGEDMPYFRGVGWIRRWVEKEDEVFES